VTGGGRESKREDMSAQVNDQSVLPPPEPRDEEGTRPKLDLANVISQVRQIQEKLAGERAAREAAKEKVEKVEKVEMEKGEGK
jgi:hypothetical protein